MKYREKFLTLFAGIFLSFYNIAVIAQQCSHVAGNWLDNYSLIWYLTQNGGSVTGSVYVSACASPYFSVDGSMYNGQVDVWAINSNWNDPVCALYFEYEGDIAPGGCNIGDGDWNNSSGYSGSWIWAKECEVPPYEVTNPNTGKWEGPQYRFDVNMANANGHNLVGRYIKEQDYAPAVDTCWYSGSPIPKWTGITQPDPVGIFGEDNGYTDLIGWGSTSITHYRAHGDAPCDAHIFQEMIIQCGSLAPTWQHVQYNVLIADIGVTTVTSTRDAVQKGPIPYP